MALPLANSFEGGSQGTTLTTGNSGGASGDAFDAVQNTTQTVTFDGTNQAHASGLALKIATAATVTATYVQWSTALGTLSTNQTLAGRFYYVAPGTPSSTVRLLQILAGGSVLCGLGHASGTGNIGWRLVDAATGTAGGNALPTSTLVRVEFLVTGLGAGAGAGNATARFFLGDGTAAQGTDATMTAVGLGSAAPDSVRMGVTTANASISSSYWFDGLQVNATDFPGPESTNTPATGVLHRMPLGV